MSRNRHISKEEERTDINISPMIDMVFILLIFFIVTTVFVDESGLDVDKPTPSSEPQKNENEEPVTFRVTKSNQVVYKGNVVQPSRVETIVRERLAENKELPVIFQIERGAFAGPMVQALDGAKSGGALKMSVSSVD